MIYTVTLNPALDKTVQIPNFRTGAVNRITTLRTDPGGKGINVSRVLQNLHEPSVAAAILGGTTGHEIAAALESTGTAGLFLFTEQQTRTNLKIIDPILHTNTDINEPGTATDPAVLNELLSRLCEKIVPGDLVVLSGKAPAGAPQTLYRDWALQCRAAGADVFVDAEGALLSCSLEAHPALIKPNLEELSGILGYVPESEAETLCAARTLLAQGVGCVVVTMGADGALFCWEDCALRAQSPRVSVLSTVGAGDSVVAALACARQRGFSHEATARLAMAAGAAAVMCPGTQAAELSAMEALIPQVTVQHL